MNKRYKAPDCAVILLAAQDSLLVNASGTESYDEITIELQSIAFDFESIL